jgi:hypothetical protein
MDIPEIAIDYFGNQVYLGFILISLVGLFSNLLSVFHIRKSVTAKPHFIFLLNLDSVISMLASTNIFAVSIYFFATNGITPSSGDLKAEEFLKT